MRDSISDRLAFALIAVFLIFIVIFGWKYHPVEQVDSAERDSHVSRAQQFRNGHVPRDSYRPLLYPLLSALSGTVLGDTFAGARLISQLSVGAFLMLTYFLGQRAFCRKTALFSLICTMLNYNVITNGVLTTTDMMFSALVLAVLLCTVRYLSRPTHANLISLSLVFSLACFTRYVAVTLIPCVIVAIGINSERSIKRFVIDISLFSIMTSVFLLPHFILTARAFGDPFHNENWRNIAFKLYGNHDWSYFSRIPFDGLTSVLLHSPRHFCRTGLDTLLRFLTLDLPFETPHDNHLARQLFSGFILLSLWRLLCSLNVRRAILLLFVGTYTIVISFSFFPKMRVMLPVLPLYYLILGHFVTHCDFQDMAGGKKFRSIVFVAGLAGVLALQFCHIERHLSAFVRQHPLEEVEAIRMLERDYGPGITIAGTFPFLDRYTNCRYVYLEDAFGEETHDRNLYYQKLQETIKQHNVDFLVIGRLSLRHRPNELLRALDVPPFLESLTVAEDFALYGVCMRGKP